MAMNKLEKATLEKAQRENRMRQLMTLLPRIPPDMPAPECGHEIVGWKGAVYSSSVSVSRIRSSVSTHYRLDLMGRKVGSGSQGSISLYSTRELAYEAAKRDYVWDAAEDLLNKVEQYERNY